MPRTWFINGQTMVTVSGPAGSLIPGPTQLGLSLDPIEVSITIHSEPLICDAYGKNNPADEQVFGGEATITMNLVHFNFSILNEVVRLSFPPTVTEGTLGQAGWRRGVALPLNTQGNSYCVLGLSASLASQPNATPLPWTFPATYLKDEPYRMPLGAEKSILRLTWRALAYAIDPWGNGTGSLGVPLYTRTFIDPVAAANP